MEQRVIKIPTNKFTSLESVISKINTAVEGKNVNGVFFNRLSLMRNEIEILVSDPMTIEIEKIVERLIEVPIEVPVEKEVPLKIVNQVKKRRGASSQYRGVCKKGYKWYAMLQHNGKKYWCGSYFHEIEAAEAYDRKAVSVLGKKALDIVNFPENYEKA